MVNVPTSKEGVASISGEAIAYRWRCEPGHSRLSIHAEDGWNEIPFTFPSTFEIDRNNTERIIRAWIKCSPDADKFAFKIRLICQIDH